MSHSKLYKLILLFVLNRWAVAIANSAPQLAVYPTILLGVAPCPNHKGSIMDEDEGRLPNIIGLLSRIKDELERIADVLEYQAGKL